MALTKVTYSMIEGSPINILDFGVTGDGVTDDSAAIQSAIEYASANNNKLYVPSGTYLLGTGILIDEAFDICIEGDAAVRPRFVGTQALADAGGRLFSFLPEPTVTGLVLTSNIKPNERTITLSSATALSAGMVIHWSSNVLWPYENGGSYYKGDVHEILKVSGSTVTLCDSTRDTYNTTQNILMSAWTPSKLSLKNLEFEMPLPTGSISPQPSTGCVNIYRTIDAIIENCQATGATFFGFRNNWCINTRYKDIQTKYLRGIVNGYGISDRSSVGTRVNGLYSYACRRAYDAHSNDGQAESAPNRDAIVERFEIYGGGDLYPDQPLTTAYRSSGIGMHGPSEGIRIQNGYVRDLADSMKVRGKSTAIQNVNFINQLGYSCVEATYGTGLVVQNCIADWDNYPNKLASLSDAVAGSGVVTFVDFGGGDETAAWDFSLPVVITNNTILGGTSSFIGINNMPTVKYLDVNNNIIQAAPGDGNYYYLVSVPDEQASLIWKSSFIGNIVTCLNGDYQMNGPNVNFGNTGSGADLVTGVLVDNRSYTVFMQDDSVHMLRFDMEGYDSTGGLQRPVFMVSGDAIGTGMVQIYKESTTFTQLVGSNPTWVGYADGEALTGTTGTDGNLTFGLMNDGRLYIENRTGLERSLRVSFIA